VDAETLARIRDLVGKLNHRAKVLEASYGKVDVKEIINTGIFSLERAQTGYGWLQDLHAMTLKQVSKRMRGVAMQAWANRGRIHVAI
jgi:G3E family GTPase